VPPSVGMDRVSERELFMGNGLSPISDKGRLTIPAELRSTIEVNAEGRILVLTQHDSSPCLIGFDTGWATFLNDEINRDEALERSAGRNFDRPNTRRRAFSNVVRLPFDASGRFIFNGHLRDEAKLTDFAFFNGVGDVFEIWNPQTLIDAPDVDDGLKRACAWHMKNRAAK
jgi:MraZ protein